MDYHDFIWDLGGTLLDNYETSTKAFVATLHYFQREADHDSVYAALKVSTDYAVQQFASDFPDFLGEYKKREKEALEIPCLFEGTEELLDRLTADGARHFLVSTVTIM
jgi:phosphoglycolate phosphatase